MSSTDWSQYKPASLSDTQPIDYPDPLEALLRDPTPRLLPDWPKPPGCWCPKTSQAQACENRCDDSMSESSPPTARDRNVGLIVCLALFGATPILFVYAVIKLFE